MNPGRASAFTEAFARALAEERVSLGELSRHLTLVGTPITIASLSYWRTGRSEPQRGSMPAIANVEQYLGMAHGTLLDLLLPPDAERPKPLHRIFPSRGVARLLQRLGVERFDLRESVAFRVVWLEQSIQGPGEAAVLTQRYVGRVRRGPLHSLPILVWSDPEPAEPMTDFSPLYGATLDEPVFDEELRLTGMLMHLDRPHDVGERLMFGFIARTPSLSHEQTVLEHRVFEPGTLMVLECNFLGDPPSRFERAFINADATEKSDIRELRPHSNRFTAVYQDPPLGKALVTWDW
ncbi:MAG: hypothetical protein V9F00_03740 [Nocardioides sp.]